MSKIKSGDTRVDIKQLKPADMAGNAVIGGYNRLRICHFNHTARNPHRMELCNHLKLTNYIFLNPTRFPGRVGCPILCYM